MKFDTVSRYLREYVKRSDVGKMPATEVHARLGTEDFHVLDCNLEFMWQRAHLPGAVYVGYDGLSPELLPARRDATLVFYCGSSL